MPPTFLSLHLPAFLIRICSGDFFVALASLLSDFARFFPAPFSPLASAHLPESCHLRPIALPLYARPRTPACGGQAPHARAATHARAAAQA
eukprot:2934978-Pleurochrysis_carterae.AAC.2